MSREILKITIMMLILISWSLISAQANDMNNKKIIGWVTSETDTIDGIGLCMVRFRYERSTVNGVDFQLPGSGIMSLLIWNYAYSWNRLYDSPPSKDDLIEWRNSTAVQNGSKTNGVALSLFGNSNNSINGLSVSGWTSWNRELNGFSLNPFQNNIFQLNGLAIGLLNGSYEMTGCQIGLWNRGNIVHGAQLGVLVNHADEVHGVQLGLINYTDILNGCQIGLFNMYHNQTVKQDEMSFRVGWPIINWKF